jgi:hypothetical protein
MRTIHEYDIVNETDEEQRAAGRYNPGLVLKINGRRLPISAGYKDDIHIFDEHGIIFVLSINRGLDYVGVEAFEIDHDTPFGEVFLDCDHQIADVLGPRGLDLEPITMAKRLAEYCYI